MSRGVFFYSDSYLNYDMGPGHPMQPIRLKKTFDLLDAYGAFGRIELAEPQPCPMEVLSQTHSESFIRAVEAAESGKPNPGRYLAFGLGTGDNPIFPGIMSAARLYTGGSLDAAGIVADGVSRIAMNISGGLHHAHYARASGFCVFNDCAVAIRRLRERFERVAYVDIDVHHGDGVQELFYSDPSVMTISIHETGLTLYPGTGFPQDIGEAKGRGYSVNIPVWPNTDDALWLKSWRSVGLAALTAFDPQAIVLQIGADAHALDPLAHVMLSAQGWSEAISDVVSLETPIVALGGGGYNMTTVPRMWAMAASTLFGLNLPNETPDGLKWHDEMPTLADPIREPIDSGAIAEAERANRRYVEESLTALRPYHNL